MLAAEFITSLEDQYLFESVCTVIYLETNNSLVSAACHTCRMGAGYKWHRLKKKEKWGELKYEPQRHRVLLFQEKVWEPEESAEILSNSFNSGV